jgi:two-component system sensor histidine kinase AlgZ
MHPVLDTRRHLLVYVLTWLLLGGLLAMGLGGFDAGLLGVALFVPLSLAYALVCLSTWYLCRVFPLGTDVAIWKALAVHGLASVLASAIWGAMGTAWAGTVDTVAGGVFFEGTSAAQIYADRGPELFVVGVLLYWLAAAFHYLLIAFEASREAERRALELNLLAREAELKALRAQIDPHFIFNSLHSISALTTTDPVSARRMCLLLADFLRETLRLGAVQRISLADEFALADRFLAIEQIRLGSRLQVTRVADPDAGPCLVPPLLLQPLVENAVVHGVAQLVEGGTIRIVARRSGPVLTITLENPCDPERRRSRGVGLGLELLRRRLITQFGAYDAVLATESDGCFRVEVRIPAVVAV